MAMTKKEKVIFDSAIQRANMLAALRWTEPVEKDVPIPKDFGASTSGWDFNAYTATVKQMWSEICSHGSGLKRAGSASQNGVRLFSTKILALRALRYAVECESAEKLRKIDDEIASEMRMNEKTSG